jgi:hypothetical protein
MANQARRAGALNAALLVVLLVSAVTAALPLFFGSLALGIYLVPKAAPAYLMYAWDGLIATFLLFWAIGLFTELQRTEPLALSKFLHLPVSVREAFLINYVSSWLTLSLICFGPIMLGFALALVIAKGAALFVVLPALAAFLVMITALTYQFRGWLGALMSNPRRRRTVIVAATMSFILFAQLPNFLNFLAGPMSMRQAKRVQRSTAELQRKQAALNAQQTKEMQDIQRDRETGKLDAAEFDRRFRELLDKQKHNQEEAARAALHTSQVQQREFGNYLARLQYLAWLANAIVPFGWLPVGVMHAAEGNLFPGWLGFLGMAAIGGASLWRALRTTVGMYEGRYTGGGRRRAGVQATTSKPGDLPANPLEARLPGVTEPVAAIALGGFRSLLRAPEVKMILLSPVIVGVIFGSILYQNGERIPGWMRPLVGVGAMFFVLLSMLQLLCNQFGFDRDGFRLFVLGPARRRDILFGKNLACAPLALAMAAFLLAVAQAVCPLRVGDLLAMLPQYVSMYVVLCLVANVLSILTPIYVAPGALKPSSPKLVAALVQMLVIFVVLPLTQAVTLVPLAVATVARFAGLTERAPVLLVLNLVVCALVVSIYSWCLGWQGRLLQSREQRILETVTTRPS